MQTKPAAAKKKSRRIVELDYIRGFFILVIIIDHLQRWPSPLSYITGEGRLWVSAAEGFFIISGLLIGYLRGAKAVHMPMRALAEILVKRAATLYLWSVIITFAGVWLMQIGPYNPDLLPKLPETSGLLYMWQVISQQYVFDWIYFLRLYWMMLLAAPLAVWAYRRGKWWLVPLVSLSLYLLSLAIPDAEAALQWQFLFFGAATVGFHFDKIMSVLRAHVRLKAILMVGLILVTLATMMLSYFWVLGWGVVESHHSSMTRDTYTSVRAWLDMWFTKSPLAIGRVVLSFIWFAGILAFIHLFIHFTEKYLRWLLLPLGTYSLTSYCIQAIVLIPMQMYIPLSGALLNTLIAFAAVLLVRVLVTQRHVHRILPQ